jgi:hypothetical protein
MHRYQGGNNLGIVALRCSHYLMHQNHVWAKRQIDSYQSPNTP